MGDVILGIEEKTVWSDETRAVIDTLQKIPHDGQDVTVQLLSGILFSRVQGMIEITDDKNPEVLMRFKVVGDIPQFWDDSHVGGSFSAWSIKRVREYGALDCTLKTKDGDKHVTRLQANPIYQSIVAYIQQIQGYPLGALMGVWWREPQNTMYRDNLSQYEKALTFTDDPKAAAMATWTGRQAQQLGYTSCEVQITKKAVMALFLQPS